ncbi:MAG: 2-octaprenyl-6-methoxyphenyl hydroxylase [Thiohalophilus sp.]
MNASSPNEFDLVIVGGGLVGASLACALAESPLRIAMVEAQPFNTEQHPGFDARTVALAAGSQQIFAAMGLWEAIAAQGVTPIRRIHVSDRGHLGSTHLDADEQGLAAMGYVADIRVLGRVLSRQLEQQANVTLFCPASVRAVQFAPAQAQVVLRQDDGLREITAALVVAADGGNSFIRNDSGIATFTLDYHQSALISNVAVDRPHRNIAYERFTDSGPMALLPTRDEQGNDNAFALVWTLKPDQVQEVQDWDDTTFLSQLQERFGERAGRFTRSSQRHLYPLKFLQTREHVRPRLAVIGNAAHTLHPVAGQGFNLGLRDVAVLSQVLSEALTQGEDIGGLNVLRRYAQWRRRDHLQTSLATDALVRVFSNNFLPLAVARNLGLTLLDTLPPLKKQLVRHAMGYVGKLPRLARGLKL